MDADLHQLDLIAIYWANGDFKMNIPASSGKSLSLITVNDMHIWKRIKLQIKFKWITKDLNDFFHQQSSFIFQEH